ncbi:response regulator [filamentous cyanobacterium LEGE 11480]|uniref:Circadian input-output histidine kinase CikA n=1 Tax=Romeriopsis navalis LEGE 11480 TaxID=2777977 RepID=A0A928Z243_9CYAN|nr:response regulator [Romeriopsis navalis]MBE9029149.1 response regulator [Romeriopsis navalis LEGE 11480]
MNDAASSDQNIKVLLVEDDTIDRLAFSKYVQEESLPYDYVLASSLAEAQSILAQESFAVAILDHQLGDGTALELLQQVKQKNLAFVIATGSGDEATAARLMQEGAYDYLIKDPERNYLKVLPTTINQAIARKQSEAQIRRLTHAMRSIRDSIYMLDHDQKLTFINRSMSELCGITETAAIGQPIAILGQPALTRYIAQSPIHCEQSDDQEIELTITHTDGSIGAVSLSESYIQDGLAQVRVGVMRDITSRNKAELALRASEQRYITLASIAPVGIFRADTQGNCLYVNQRWCDISGLTPDAAVGLGWLRALHPDDREQYQRAWQQAMQENTGIFQLEYRFQAPPHSTKSETWVFGQAVQEKDLQGNNIGYVATVTDISERKRAEALLQSTNQELARATRLKDEFLANMSHELRTPLNAILGMTEGLQDQVFGIMNAKQQKALHTIDRSAIHLLELINDILDLAKIESGQVELDYAPTDITLLCQSSLTFVKQQAFKKHIQLQLSIQTDLPAIHMDERRIRQVLINLLNNAVKFTPEDGRVTLEVQMHPSTITDTSPTSPQISFKVIDTGIGIAPEQIDNLFQPFIQIDSALNRQYTGTGLGLSLVKRMVELHGGQVHLSSQIDHGSEFKITLPCPDFATRASLEKVDVPTFSPPMPLEQTGITQGPKILLAEDNEVNIITISSYLGASGYELVIAHDGQTAIEMIHSQQPDLVLMDVQMPGIDGLEAISRIRQDETLAELPIIVLTALAMDGDRERCLATGANAYLAKPVKLKQLAATIQQYLTKHPPESNPIAETITP